MSYLEQLKSENMLQGSHPKAPKGGSGGFGGTTQRVFSPKKAPPDRITTGTIYEGGLTDEALETAERIYNHLAEMERPCFENAILAAAGRDAAFSRSVLFRLVVEGFIEYLGGGEYQIPGNPKT